MRFDEFMQQALHHPETGYYSNNIQTVGANGDFSTTATMSTALGMAISQSALRWAKENKTKLNLIEIGGGDGSLAKTIIKSIPFFKRLSLKYHIVDSSSPLIKKQQQDLGRKVNWHTDVTSALKQCNGIAFIFSNELVDAFPVRVFKKNNGLWSELFIHQGKERFYPSADTLLESSTFDDTNHREEQRVEIHQSYREWLNDWLPNLEKGQILTIDYGDTYSKIYYRMPKGTLRAYSNHQRLIGDAIYLNPGKQDITADVNFTDLIEWGKSDGLDTVSLLSQAEYLENYVTESPADQFLIHPEGAGSAFKVLLQQKG